MCCGFVGDVIGGVVDAIGSVASFVIDNALPIIETVAFDYFIAPGFGDVISSALDISSSIAGNIATGIGHAAISALNGGSLSSIAAAGLAPLIASPDIQQKVFGGSITGPGGVINSAVSSVISDPTMAKVISGAVGQAGAAGVVAAVTGGDIMKAASMAGLSSVVAQSIGQTWNTVKANVPAMDQLSTSFSNLADQIKPGLPVFTSINDMQTKLEAQAQSYNDMLAKYQDGVTIYQGELANYNNYKANSDVTNANNIAKDLNNNIIPKLNDFTTQVQDAYKSYQASQTSFTDYLTANKATIDQYTPMIQQLNSYQSQYDVMANQIQAQYSQYQLTDAIKNGDYTAAAKYQSQFENYNNQIAKVDQSAVVGHTLTNDQIKLLDQINATTDPTAQAKLIAQANSNAGFQSIKNSTPDTTVPGPTGSVTQPPASTPIAPTSMGAAVTPTSGTSYDTLPKLPANGVPSTDTTSTTPSTTPTPTPPTSNAILPTAMGAAVTPTVGGFVDKLTNSVGNIIEKGTIGTIANNITGNTPSTPKTPTLPPKPPSHVDVSTLTPVTGGLPTNLPGSTTGNTTGTTTGGLPSTGGTTTNTGTTPTQTGTGGLTSGTTSTTPTAPPAKVDVSTLKPVTDTAYLHSLGIV
jgi:hypothetical protein